MSETRTPILAPTDPKPFDRGNAVLVGAGIGTLGLFLTLGIVTQALYAPELPSAKRQVEPTIRTIAATALADPNFEKVSYGGTLLFDGTCTAPGGEISSIISVSFYPGETRDDAGVITTTPEDAFSVTVDRAQTLSDGNVSGFRSEIKTTGYPWPFYEQSVEARIGDSDYTTSPRVYAGVRETIHVMDDVLAGQMVDLTLRQAEQAIAGDCTDNVPVTAPAPLERQ